MMAVYEEWRQYRDTNLEVSSLGKIRRVGATSVLKLYAKNEMYFYLCTTLSGKRVTLLAHRMVAETFLKNQNNLPCVNHKDGNKQNNCVNNLEWVSYSENTKHSYDTGLLKKRFGEDHHLSKLTTEQVREIKNRYISRCRKNGTRALGREFGVKHQTISDIINGKIWKGV